jgi:PhzF family phenazine biosynthesis protein
MAARSFQVDAFTGTLFGGNPAAVVLLDEYPPDAVLKKIAMENNLPETAFLVKNGRQWRLRWFTPDIEMDLCGHATLASAHILFTETGFSGDTAEFETVSGILRVKRESTTDGAFYTMDLPSRPAVPSNLPEQISESLDRVPVEVYKARDYMLVFDKESDIREISINRSIMDGINLGTGGVIITAPGVECDFVSRFFTPGATLFEDPVTGSAHCTLVPYWAEKTGHTEMVAMQLSQRGGKLFCRLENDKVFIGGNAVTWSSSLINI